MRTRSLGWIRVFSRAVEQGVLIFGVYFLLGHPRLTVLTMIGRVGNHLPQHCRFQGI